MGMNMDNTEQEELRRVRILDMIKEVLYSKTERVICTFPKCRCDSYSLCNFYKLKIKEHG